ncbi:MAG: rhodanese-like domain-containing protein [Planctomycetota bacterium]
MSDQAVSEWTPMRAKAAVDAGEAVLLDVRTAEELGVAAIEGAVHVPMNEVMARFGEIEGLAESGKTIVTVCHHGVRSMNTAVWLVGQGVEVDGLEGSGIVSMAGGIDRWSLEVDGGVPRY